MKLKNLGAAACALAAAVLGAPARAQETPAESDRARIERLEREVDELKRERAADRAAASAATATAAPSSGSAPTATAAPRRSAPDLSDRGSGVAPADSDGAWRNVPPNPSPARHSVEETPVFSWAERVRLGTWIFGGYGYDVAPSWKDENGFWIGRAYLNMVGDLDQVKARITANLEPNSVLFTDNDQNPDLPGKPGAHTGPPASGYTFRLKYAWLEGDLGALSPALEGQRARIGQIDPPWVKYDEELWDYRFQSRVFENNEGYLSPSDDGAALDGRFGRLGYMVEVDNGSGFTNPNVGKGKQVEGRATVALVGPLALSSYGAYGEYGGGEPKWRWVEQLSWKSPWLTLAVNSFLADDPRTRIASSQPGVVGGTAPATARGFAHAYGGSAFMVLPLAFIPHAEGFDAVARVDFLEPDAAVAHVYHWRQVEGVSYRLNAYARIMVDYDGVHYSNKGEIDSRSVLVQFEVAF